MSKVHPLFGFLGICLLLNFIVLPIVQGMGWAAVAVQMDRSSGDKRRVLQIFDSNLHAWSDTPMWFAEYATERRGDWVTVHRNTGWYGARENWRWGGTHALLHTFGKSLHIMGAGDDVRMSAAQEVLRLMQSEDDPWLLGEVVGDALMRMWDRVDGDEILDAEGVRAAFHQAEAGKHASAKP